MCQSLIADRQRTDVKTPTQKRRNIGGGVVGLKLSDFMTGKKEPSSLSPFSRNLKKNTSISEHNNAGGRSRLQTRQGNQNNEPLDTQIADESDLYDKMMPLGDVRDSASMVKEDG